jgi:ribosomal protein S18 acetylase RimI-like enzyme
MNRPALPADTFALQTLAAGTGVFKPHEIDALGEVLDDYHAVNHGFGHLARVWDIDGTPAGFVYLAPTAMTDRTWELWWIAVDVRRQGRGLGAEMLRAVEGLVADASGRLLLIETSSTAIYQPTRQFYRKHGYADVATIPDFYADGDGKVIFHKRIDG